MNTPELGDKVKCMVTGLTGLVVAISTYLAGCDRIAIQPPVKDDKVPEPYWIDITLAEVVEKSVVKLESDTVPAEKKKTPGGDPNLIPRFNDPKV